MTELTTVSLQIRSELNDDMEIIFENFPYDFFMVDLKVSHVTYFSLGTVYTRRYHRSDKYPRYEFLSQDTGSRFLLSMFENMGVTQEFPELFLEQIVHEILSISSSLNVAPGNRGRKVIKLFVEIIIDSINEEDDDDDDQVIDDSLMSSTINFKPASKSSIQGLKRVKYLGSTSKNQCSICLDEFSEGEEVASMPCGHVYHDVCIVQWLETSCLCPLCRYEMATT